MSSEEKQPLLIPSAEDKQPKPSNKNDGNIQEEDNYGSSSSSPPAASASASASTAAQVTTVVSPREKEDTSSNKEQEEKKKKKNEDDSSNDDDEEDYEEDKIKQGKFKQSPEERARTRFIATIILALCYLLLIITWIVVLVTDSVKLEFTTEVPATWSEPLNNESMLQNSSIAPEYYTVTEYGVQHMVGDLFVVDCIRTAPALVFYFILRGKPYWFHPYIFNFSMFFWFIITAKAWAFHSWASSLNAIPMWMSLVTSTIALFTKNVIFNCDIAPNLILTWSGIKNVMGPYFAPKGTWNRAIMIGLWFIVGCSKASSIVSPIILGQAVTFITDRNLYDGSVRLIIFGVLSVLPQLLESIQDAVSSYIWMASYREVAEKSFSHCLNLDLHWHTSKKLGKVMRSIDRGMNAAERLCSWFLMWIFPNIGSGVISFVVFVAHFKLPIVAAVCWFSLCNYLFVTILITKVRRRYNEKENVHDNDAHDNSTDALINIEVVKSFTNEDMEINRYVESVRRMQTFSYKGMLFTGVVNTSQSTIINVCTVAALVLAAIYAVHNSKFYEKVEIGPFVAISQYLNNLFSPLSFIGSLYSMGVTNLVDIQNLADILEHEAEIKDKPDAVPFREKFPLIEGIAKKEQEGISIEFDDVYFNYPNQDEDKGLQGVSFMIPAQSSCGLVGTTGSGKSTIATKLLFQFYQATKGTIKFNGVDAKEFTAKSLRKEIGIVPQSTILFNESLKYNIAYGRPDATEEEIDEAIKIAQLEPCLERLKDGKETKVGERGVALSGGECQRTAIARCVLKNPSVLIFDEATSALDNETERNLQDALDKLSGGKRTTITVAHRLTTIQNCDQIFVMEKGQIIERGKHQELLDKNGKYYQMWNAQKKAAEEEIEKVNEGDDDEKEGESPKKKDQKAKKDSKK